LCIEKLKEISILLSNKQTKTVEEFIILELIPELNRPEKIKKLLHREVWGPYSFFDEDAKLLIRLPNDW
jgi:hypothetical protein